MANSIRLTTGQWADIRQRIREEYPTQDSVLIIRSVMQRELGFTTRLHREWLVENNTGGEYDGYGDYQESIYLDFVDDNKETFFRLKYL
jgi:hypothetical protein